MYKEKGKSYQWQIITASKNSFILGIIEKVVYKTCVYSSILSGVRRIRRIFNTVAPITYTLAISSLHTQLEHSIVRGIS